MKRLLQNIPGLSNLKFQAQPAGVLVMFFVQLFSVIGFAYLYSLLALYAINHLGLKDHQAYTLTGAFNALPYASCIFGGYLAGRYLGYRFSIGLGLLVGAISLFILIIPTKIALYWGLSFFVAAEGLIIPSLFVVLGRLYERGDPRRLSGFILIYIGINVGAFLAEASAGVISNTLGFRYAFFLGALFMLVALYIFLLNQRLYSSKGFVPQYDNLHPEAIKRSRLMGICWLIISLPILALLFHFTLLTHILLILFGIVAMVYVFHSARREGRAYRKRMYAFGALVILTFVILIFYMLIPSVLMIFIERNVNHAIWGVTLHTTSFAALNPFFIVIAGAFASVFWIPKYHKQFSETIPAKIAVGGFAMSLGYFALVAGTQLTGYDGFVSPWWVILSYFLQTIAELCTVPVMFAMVGELVPVRLEGLMMGIWLFMTGVAASIAVFFADFISIPEHITAPYITDAMYGQAFLIYGGITMLVAIIAALLVPVLRSLIQAQPL